MRLSWLLVGACVTAGCHTPHPPAVKGNLTPQPPSLRGKGEPDEISPLAPPSLLGKGVGGLGSSPDPDPLTLAAECLDRGDRTAAATHLDAYVGAHPDQIMFRAHLAELLLQLDRPAAAQAHFERFVATAQEATGPPRAHLVHCHTRLMEIAQRGDDRAGEVFHRGVGLLLLAGQMPAGDEAGEAILCRAVAALAEAKELRPTDPRVRLYLADAYDRAGNRRGAAAARAAARHLAAPGALAPAEGRRLAMLP